MHWDYFARTYSKTILLAAVFGLLVAACGGGDSGVEPADTETSSLLPTTTAPVDEDLDTTTSAAVVTTTFEDSGPYYELFEVGVCWNDDGNYSDPIPPVDCAQDHDAEIFAMQEFQAGPDEPYPGDDAIGDLAYAEVCDSAYEQFMGVSSESRALGYSVLTPQQADWERGDRTIVCQVEDSVPLIGTAASAGFEIPGVVVIGVGQVDDVVDLFASVQGQEAKPITTDLIEENTYPPAVLGNSVIYGRWTSDEYVERNIVSLDTTTGEITPLLSTPSDEAMPRVSPDGSQIVFMSSQDAEEFDIWVMGSDGSSPSRLTQNPDRDSSPAWSPDGTKIVYRARIDGVSNLWIMNADGSEAQQLSDDAAGDYDPVFSPDGTKIAFTSERDGNLDVWVMNADGSDPQNLSNHPATDEYPAWTLDGEAIVFTSNRFRQTLWVMKPDGSEQSLFSGSSLIGYGTVVGTLG